MTAEAAVVTRVATDGGVYFTLNRLTGPDEEHGPARPILPAFAVTPDSGEDFATTSTEDPPDGDLPTHVHTVTLRPLQQGDAIVVQAIGGIADQWVVLGRIG